MLNSFHTNVSVDQNNFDQANNNNNTTTAAAAATRKAIKTTITAAAATATTTTTTTTKTITATRNSAAEPQATSRYCTASLGSGAAAFSHQSAGVWRSIRPASPSACAVRWPAPCRTAGCPPEPASRSTGSETRLKTESAHVQLDVFGLSLWAWSASRHEDRRRQRPSPLPQTEIDQRSIRNRHHVTRYDLHRSARRAILLRSYRMTFLEVRRSQRCWLSTDAAALMKSSQQAFIRYLGQGFRLARIITNIH